MEWHHFETMYDSIKSFSKKLGLEEFYDGMINKLPEKYAGQCLYEYQWIKSRRPFFNVYPSIIEGLRTVKLDLHGMSVRDQILALPEEIVVQFPKGKEPTQEDICIKSFLLSRLYTENKDGLGIWCDFGEVAAGTPVYCFMKFPLEDKPIEETIKEMPTVDVSQAETDAMMVCIRTFLGIALMHSDPDLVEPICLAADREKYLKTLDPKYIDKAKRRGRFGWNVGSHVEISPHMRRAHFGIRHTGTLGKIPKLVPIKRSIVKKHKITEVPTGYLGE